MSKTKRAELGTTGVFANEKPTELARRTKTTRLAEAPKPVERPDREGRAPMPFWTTVAAKRQLRILAAELDSTQQELMGEALNDLFVKHGKPPIA